jgi:hypothetical protein
VKMSGVDPCEQVRDAPVIDCPQHGFRACGEQVGQRRKARE